LNTFHFEEVYLGLSASFEVIITQAMLDQFVALSGDNSSLHTNEAFAREKGYAGTPVHGMLTASFYSQLVGVHLPGNNGYSQEYKIAFTAPVYVGDVLTVSCEIEYINDVLEQLWIQAQIINGDGVKVSRAKIKAGFL
jgi:3-hydroxybutyryl-CoA dehydratase